MRSTFNDPFNGAPSFTISTTVGLDPTLLGRATRTLAKLAADAGGTPDEFRETLLMLGVDENALRSTQSDSDPASRHPYRDSVGRATAAPHAPAMCKPGKHAMVGTNVGRGGGHGRRYCVACRRANRPKPTVCANGHVYAEVGVVLRTDGVRICRRCHADRWGWAS